MKRLAVGLMGVLVLSACAESATAAKPAAPPAAGVCRASTHHPPAVLFLAKEAVPEELEGLTYFAEDWGRRQGCFKGTVVSAAGTDTRGYEALVVDVSHDASLSPGDVATIRSFVQAGKRVALFSWPIRLKDDSVLAESLGQAPSLFGDALLIRAKGCGDWEFSKTAATPFGLEGTSYRYENFAASIFTVKVSGPQRAWAKTLFCPSDPGAVIVEVPNGIVAGFSIGYTVSLADNNVRSVTMKRLLVDVIAALAGTSRPGG